MSLLRLRVLALSAVMLFGRGAAAAAMLQRPGETDVAWTIEQPLTGRPIPCDKGKIKIFACENVELLSFLPANAFDGLSGSDLWGWTDSATHREFVIIGGYKVGGTAFIEVTDPTNPKYLGSLLPYDSMVPKQSVAQSVKVYKNHAFIGYEANNGLQIFDLTQLRDVKQPPVVFKETARYDGFTNTHTIALNEQTGFLYANGTNTCNGGLHMLDVRTPTKPVFAGCFVEASAGGFINSGGYVHDTQCVIYRGPDQQHQGREICLNSSSGSLVIADVTDKQHPKTVSITRYPHLGYVHQGWLTEDQQHFFINDEMTGGPNTRTIGLELRDLDEPVVITDYYNPKIETTAHNFYIRGRYMYQGNFEGGFRIIDIADPKHPKEVGYLTNVGGAWGTYPFFKDDVAAVPTSAGLFLARLLKR